MPSQPDVTALPTVLVVDDQDTMRTALVGKLRAAGYDVIAANSGEVALRVLANRHVDAVVLDLVMPGIHGIGVLRSLTTRTPHQYVPVIVITAVTDPRARAEALRFGAADYLVKPFDFDELRFRLATVLDAQAHRFVLVQKQAELVRLQEFRDDVVALLGGDLRMPITAMLSNLSYVAGQLEPGRSEMAEAVADSAEGARALQRTLGNLADVARAEAGSLRVAATQFDVAELLFMVRDVRARELRQHGLLLDVRPEPVEIVADRGMLQRALETLIDHAMRELPRGARISLHAWHRAARVQIEMSSNAPLVAPGSRGRLFDRLGPSGRRGNSPAQNLGLGLYFCQLAVTSHGGTIALGESPPLPSRFIIDLPDRPEESGVVAGPATSMDTTRRSFT